MNNFDAPAPKPKVPESWKLVRTKEGRNPEEIRVGDPLPTEYQEVLDSIPETIPAAYKAKMQEAAYYFWSLDEGKELTGKNGTSLKNRVDLMAEQIARSGFVLQTYQPLLSKGVKPSEALPHWVLELTEAGRLKRKKSKENINQVVAKQTYDNYAAQTARTIEKRTNGEFAFYDKGVVRSEARKITNHSKGYIEESLMHPEKVIAAFTELAENNVHPDASKYFEGYVVLYWHHHSDENAELIRKIFKKHDTHMRGFAQDPVVVTVNETGKQEVSGGLIGSNDGSLGSWGRNDFVWRGKPYNKREFFHQYLRLVTFGGKDPTEPYKIGFVRIDKREYKGNKIYIQGLVAGLEKQENLPVIVSDRGVVLDEKTE